MVIVQVTRTETRMKRAATWHLLLLSGWAPVVQGCLRLARSLIFVMLASSCSRKQHLHLLLPLHSAMAAAAQLSYFLIGCPSLNLDKKCLGFSRHLSSCPKFAFFFSNVDQRLLCKAQLRRLGPSPITCSASNKPDISSTAKIRSEVLSPFRSVRMFFYLAFVASGALGGLIATTQLIAALSNPSRAAEVPDILKGLGIDIGAVSVFAFLYYRENIAKNAQLAKLSREESLSNLRIRVDEKRILPVSAFRGIARLVILAGPASFIADSFNNSEPFTDRLVERGVLVVPFATDGSSLSFQFEDSEELKEIIAKRKRLWQLAPVYATEWSEWLAEQKKLAGVSPESPVYLSLRMDGRVRGSGVGYPPWNAFVAQLPPVKGLWSGLLDGMDGRVL